MPESGSSRKSVQHYLKNPRREGNATVWDCELDARRNSFLRDHTYGGKISDLRRNLRALPFVPLAYRLGLTDKPYGRKPGRPPAFDVEAYKRRNVVERCVGWLKQCRRVATRYEKLAVNFLAFVKLAMIRRYLHLLFSDRT